MLIGITSLRNRLTGKSSDFESEDSWFDPKFLNQNILECSMGLHFSDTETV